MNKSIEEKRDELAEEYCIRPLPDALKKDLLEYRPDNLKIIQRMEYAAHRNGFSAGYALGLEQAKVLAEAIYLYKNNPDFSDANLYQALKEFKEKVGHE